VAKAGFAGEGGDRLVPVTRQRCIQEVLQRRLISMIRIVALGPELESTDEAVAPGAFSSLPRRFEIAH